MKAYNKPEFYVEEFRVNDVVASGCDDKLSGEEWVYGPQTIECIVASEDTVFVQGTEGCTHVVDPSLNNGSNNYDKGDTWFFLDHTEDLNCGWDSNPDDDNCGNGAEYGLYYFWQGAQTEKPNNDKLKLLNHLLNFVGLSANTGTTRGNVWHGGKATPTLKQLYTSSF